MKKFTGLCIFVATTALGYVGGELGSKFGIMTEIVLGGIGTIAGVFVGWKFAQKIGE